MLFPKYAHTVQNHMWRAALPLVSGFCLAQVCPMKADESRHLPQRPPAAAFGPVWTILYLLLGVSWQRARDDRYVDAVHAVLVACLCAWLVVYACLRQRKGGVYLLASAIALTAACMCSNAARKDRVALTALTPLLAWLTVAFQLNWDMVRHAPPHRE